MTETRARRIVVLLNPAMCVGCKDAGVAVIQSAKGTRKMVNCRRRDCDNHGITEEDDIPEVFYEQISEKY